MTAVKGQLQVRKQGKGWERQEEGAGMVSAWLGWLHHLDLVGAQLQVNVRREREGGEQEEAAGMVSA
jgi:hypothetical protein